MSVVYTKKLIMWLESTTCARASVQWLGCRFPLLWTTSRSTTRSRRSASTRSSGKCNRRGVRCAPPASWWPRAQCSSSSSPPLTSKQLSAAAATILAAATPTRTPTRTPATWMGRRTLLTSACHRPRRRLVPRRRHRLRRLYRLQQREHTVESKESSCWFGNFSFQCATVPNG